MAGLAPAKESNAMTVQDNKTLIRRLIDEVANTGDLDRADALVDADSVDHAALATQAPGLAGFKQGVAMLRAAFPDLRIAIEEILADGDKVAARLTLRGTHRGPFAGLPASGKQATWAAMSIWRIAGGKVVERWLLPDAPSLQRQLGQED
jgi:steroid delta-isomerase-like uncharacterized protein